MKTSNNEAANQYGVKDVARFLRKSVKSGIESGQKLIQENRPTRATIENLSEKAEKKAFQVIDSITGTKSEEIKSSIRDIYNDENLSKAEKGAKLPSLIQEEVRKPAEENVPKNAMSKLSQAENLVFSALNGADKLIHGPSSDNLNMQNRKEKAQESINSARSRMSKLPMLGFLKPKAQETSAITLSNQKQEGIINNTDQTLEVEVLGPEETVPNNTNIGKEKAQTIIQNCENGVIVTPAPENSDTKALPSKSGENIPEINQVINPEIKDSKPSYQKIIETDLNSRIANLDNKVQEEQVPLITIPHENLNKQGSGSLIMTSTKGEKAYQAYLQNPENYKASDYKPKDKEAGYVINVNDLLENQTHYTNKKIETGVMHVPPKAHRNGHTPLDQQNVFESGHNLIKSNSPGDGHDKIEIPVYVNQEEIVATENKKQVTKEQDLGSMMIPTDVYEKTVVRGESNDQSTGPATKEVATENKKTAHSVAEMLKQGRKKSEEVSGTNGDGNEATSNKKINKRKKPNGFGNFTKAT